MKRLLPLRRAQALLDPIPASRLSGRHATIPACVKQCSQHRSFSASRHLLDKVDDQTTNPRAAETTEAPEAKPREKSPKEEASLFAEDASTGRPEVEELPDDAILEDGVQTAAAAAAAARNASAKAARRAQSKAAKAKAKARALAAAPQGTLGLLPRRQPAERPEEITDPEYVPAETGDGLEIVGGFEGWWDKGDNWNAAYDYRGFVPPEKVRDEASLRVWARAAVVEALAVREWYGADAKPILVGSWERCERSMLDRALGMSIVSKEDGTITVAGDVEAVVTGLETPVTSGAPVGDAGAAIVTPESSEGSMALANDADATIVTPEEAQEIARTMDGNWQDVPLDDVWLKFAIKKRILQTTGQNLSDAKIANVQTVKDLVDVLTTPAKPRKLAQDPVYLEKMQELPNIKVYSRRVTPIDKEKAVGRWKLIVDELDGRGLPVTGTANYSPPWERRWLLDQLKLTGLNKRNARVDGNRPGRSETGRAR